MRVMDVLPAYEVRRYNSPLTFSTSERKQYFQMDESIKTRIGAAKSEISKLGLLLQAGYLKATGRFFAVKTFKVADIKFAAKQLGIVYSKSLITDYDNRTRQRHREVLLDLYGLKPFDSAKELVMDLVRDMVSKQMHPRKMLYAINEGLRRRKIELPSYSAISRLISTSLNEFEVGKLNTLTAHITTEQTEALQQLIEKADVPYERTLLTRLKKLLRSVKPRKIQEGVRNFLIIKKLFFELLPVIEQLDLSSEATHYYASWVSKARLSQIIDMTDCHKQYLHLIAFISHYYRQWQDCLVDTLLKSVQQQLNKSEQLLLNLAQDRLPEQRQLATSVLAGFNHHKATVESVRSVLYRDDLSAEEKLQQMQTLLPKTAVTTSNADAAADKLNAQLQENKERKDEFDVLAELSRKLQNRVALLVKHLSFDLCANKDDLAYAILYYQQHSDINDSAPIAAMDNNEINAIHRDGKFNTSLYKAILFCKIANAVKRGQINLKHSYRYLSIDEYLIGEKEWQSNRDQLLEMLELKGFVDIRTLLESLKNILDKQFVEVNQSIITGKNKFVKIQASGKFSVFTPEVEKPEYDSIIEIMRKGRYVPVLRMMAQMNGLTHFTGAFKHQSIKGAKGKPSAETFYAGIFALGSNIGLQKLANTARGLNGNTLENTVNWYFSLENLYAVNQNLVDTMSRLWLPQKFKRERNLLHTSSDAQKQCISVESLNASESYKYHGNGKGANVYRFIDERGILFYSTVFSSAERDAAYVIDGLLHNDKLKSDMHSTDTHGYTEMIFAISHLIGVTFAPRIKDIASQNLVSFDQIKPFCEKKNYPIQPSYYVKPEKIEKHWDTVLRFIATIKLRRYRASTILKRLSAYPKQHALQAALKEFGRIIKSIFILKYVDDVELRQAIEKQLNKGELANKFASAVSFADPNILQSEKDDQEIAAMCKTIIQNIIILWNYIELTKIIMRSDKAKKAELLQHITNGSILSWQHVNMLGTYDFSNLASANDDYDELREALKFKEAS